MLFLLCSGWCNMQKATFSSCFLKAMVTRHCFAQRKKATFRRHPCWSCSMQTPDYLFLTHPETGRQFFSCRSCKIFSGAAEMRSSMQLGQCDGTRISAQHSFEERCSEDQRFPDSRPAPMACPCGLLQTTPSDKVFRQSQSDKLCWFGRCHVGMFLLFALQL